MIYTYVHVCNNRRFRSSVGRPALETPRLRYATAVDSRRVYSTIPSLPPMFPLLGTNDGRSLVTLYAQMPQTPSLSVTCVCWAPRCNT